MKKNMDSLRATEKKKKTIQMKQQTTTTTKSQASKPDSGKKRDFRMMTPKGTPQMPKFLEGLLLQSVVEGETEAAWLCHPEVKHVRSGEISSTTTTRRFGIGVGVGMADKTWGCGYRNLQMMFSNLVHRQDFFIPLSQHPLLSSDDDGDGPAGKVVQVPSILAWQSIIEDAWKSGFDPPGANHFSFKLKNKHLWIGTTEVYVALNRLGVRCQIVDFVKPTGPNRQHVSLMKWVENYFKSDSTAMQEGEGGRRQIIMTKKFPLYLQHKGHSRTIIGIEIDSKLEYHLLILDPARSISKLMVKKETFDTTSPFENLNTITTISCSSNTQKILNGHRLSLKKLSKHPQYQILYVREDLGPVVPFHIDAVQHQPQFHRIQSIRIS